MKTHSLAPLVAFALICAPLYAQDKVGTLQRPSAEEISGPEKITADGQPITMKAERGHSGSAVRDMDGDGLPDLLVTSFQGYVHLYKNVGAKGSPKFSNKERVLADGQPLKFHNW